MSAEKNAIDERFVQHVFIRIWFTNKLNQRNIGVRWKRNFTPQGSEITVMRVASEANPADSLHAGLVRPRVGNCLCSKMQRPGAFQQLA